MTETDDTKTEPETTEPTGRMVWVTTDMREGPGGQAILCANGNDTTGAYPIVGWLVQEARHMTLETGALSAYSTRQCRVVPGVFVQGQVLPVSELPIARGEGAEALDLSWAMRVDGATGEGVTVVVEPAPVTVQLVEPKTRKVVRNDKGDITKIVEEP